MAYSNGEDGGQAEWRRLFSLLTLRVDVGAGRLCARGAGERAVSSLTMREMRTGGWLKHGGPWRNGESQLEWRDEQGDRSGACICLSCDVQCLAHEVLASVLQSVGEASERRSA